MNIKGSGGLVCKKCGERTKIVDTRLNLVQVGEYPPGTIRTRYHQCTGCGDRFKTQEVEKLKADEP